MKKKDDHLFARLDKRFYTILTALILIGFVIALVIMFSRILFIADNTEIDSDQPYEAQHAKIPVTLKELGFSVEGEESTASVENSGSASAIIYQYENLYYLEDGSYDDYCQYGAYVCNNGIWADNFLNQKEDLAEVSPEMCDLWGADSGYQVGSGEEAGRLYFQYGDNLLYWQSNETLNDDQTAMFLDRMKTYLENMTPIY